MRHFQEKETKATATKTERSGTTTTQTEREKKKQKKEKLIHLQRKAISLTRIRPPLESITSRKQKTTNPDHQTGKKKKRKEKKRKHVEET